MSLRNKNLADLVAADFDELVEAVVEEGNNLDYKAALIGSTNDDRRKFLADICAFANAHGGDLVLGVQENNEGQASAVVPLTINADNEVLRLENMIADGLDPKLFGVRIRAVPYGAGHVLVLRVPKSISGTHRSRADQHFYVRESRSNRQLDVPAIRTRFEGELSGRTRLQEYLAQRYAAVLTDDLAIPMLPGPKAVVHIFPALRAVDEQQFDTSVVAQAGRLPVPTRPMGLDARMTFEGPLHHSNIADGRIRAFGLAHHFGVIEGVWKAATADAENTISAEGVETDALSFVVDVVRVMQQRLGVEPPLLARLAIIGGADTIIKSEDQRRYHYGDGMYLSRIGRSALVFPDVLLDRWPMADVADTFRPVFDRLWQTSGYVRSSMYQMRDGRMQWVGRT